MRTLPRWLPLDKIQRHMLWRTLIGLYAVAFILLLVLTFGLTGCGGGGDEITPPGATIGTPNCAASGVCS